VLFCKWEISLVEKLTEQPKTKAVPRLEDICAEFCAREVLTDDAPNLYEVLQRINLGSHKNRGIKHLVLNWNILAHETKKKCVEMKD